MAIKQHTAVRVDGSTLARIEEIRKNLSTEWRDATISDVMRLLIHSGLNILEERYKPEYRQEKEASQRKAPPKD